MIPAAPSIFLPKGRGGGGPTVKKCLYLTVNTDTFNTENQIHKGYTNHFEIHILPTRSPTTNHTILPLDESRALTKSLCGLSRQKVLEAPIIMTTAYKQQQQQQNHFFHLRHDFETGVQVYKNIQ